MQEIFPLNKKGQLNLWNWEEFVILHVELVWIYIWFTAFTLPLSSYLDFQFHLYLDSSLQ